MELLFLDQNFLDIKSKFLLNKTIFIDLASSKINEKICDYIFQLNFKQITIKKN